MVYFVLVVTWYALGIFTVYYLTTRWNRDLLVFSSIGIIVMGGLSFLAIIFIEVMTLVQKRSIK